MRQGMGWEWESKESAGQSVIRMSEPCMMPIRGDKSIDSECSGLAQVAAHAQHTARKTPGLSRYSPAQVASCRAHRIASCCMHVFAYRFQT